MTIDGQKLNATPVRCSRQRHAARLPGEGATGSWRPVLPAAARRRPRCAGRRRSTGLQGPIDDAFTDAFLCVRGTGKPWHEATQKYAEANLKRFQAEWAKYLRGDLPVKDDVDVTARTSPAST